MKLQWHRTFGRTLNGHFPVRRPPTCCVSIFRSCRGATKPESESKWTFYGENFSYFEFRFGIQCKCNLYDFVDILKRRTAKRIERDVQHHFLARSMRGWVVCRPNDKRNYCRTKLHSIVGARRHKNNKAIYFPENSIKNTIILCVIAFKWNVAHATQPSLIPPRRGPHSRLHDRIPYGAPLTE